MRRKIFRALFRLFRQKEGEWMSWYMVTIHYVLFPIDSIKYWLDRHCSVRYDFYSQTVQVGKMRYSRELLEGGLKDGKYFLRKEKDLIIFTEIK